MKKIGLLILLLTLFCCREDPTQLRRKDLIPKKKFIEVLTEMHLMDALSSDYQLHKYFPAGDSVYIYESIFEKYDITQAQFDTTVALYTKRPDLFLEIYNEVLVRLNYINDTLNANEPMFSGEKPHFDRE